jgi:hypothetical protein
MIPATAARRAPPKKVPIAMAGAAKRATNCANSRKLLSKAARGTNNISQAVDATPIQASAASTRLRDRGIHHFLFGSTLMPSVQKFRLSGQWPVLVSHAIAKNAMAAAARLRKKINASHFMPSF